jgi:hypothetical protein
LFTDLHDKLTKITNLICRNNVGIGRAVTVRIGLHGVAGRDGYVGNRANVITELSAVDGEIAFYPRRTITRITSVKEGTVIFTTIYDNSVWRLVICIVIIILEAGGSAIIDKTDVA